MYQITQARAEYERRTPGPVAQKNSDRNQLTALAFAVDDLLDAAVKHRSVLSSFNTVGQTHVFVREPVDPRPETHAFALSTSKTGSATSHGCQRPELPRYKTRLLTRVHR